MAVGFHKTTVMGDNKPPLLSIHKTRYSMKKSCFKSIQPNVAK